MLQLFSKKNGEINLTSFSPVVPRKLISDAASGLGAWPHGQILIQDIQLPQFFLRFMEVFSDVPDTIYFIDDPNTIMFHMQLQGTSLPGIEGIEPMVIHERGYNYYYIPERSSTLLLRKGSRQQYLQIKVPLAYMESLKERFSMISGFIGTVRLQTASRLMRYNQVSCAFMLDKVEQLQDATDPVNMERLITELLSFSVEKMSVQPKKKKATYSQIEVEKVYAAKELLMSNLETNYTLDELAGKVGVNVFKLKRVFLEIFGTSAHAIQHGERMKHAANLLHDNRRFTMAEIASMVGYDTGESFIRAFKKYYGDYPVAHRSKRANNDNR